MDLSALENKIKIKFKDKSLLQSALTHRSYLNENRKWPSPHNERLEFLGDAVLDLITANIIDKLGSIVAEGKVMDPKSKFQELAQEKLGVTPHYKVLGEWGTDHNKNFEVGVFIADKQIAKGVGASKQEAEVAAAQNGLEISDF